MEKFNDIFNKISTPITNKINRGSFTKVNNFLIDSPDYDCYEKMVLISLERFNYGKNNCWASQATIAKCAGCSKTKVKSVLANLEKSGKVIKVKNNKYKTNTYYSTTNIYRSPEAYINSHKETN
jgi:biotin operon repressor